jgi:hypothetical protein
MGLKQITAGAPVIGTVNAIKKAAVEKTEVLN